MIGAPRKPVYYTDIAQVMIASQDPSSVWHVARDVYGASATTICSATRLPMWHFVTTISKNELRDTVWPSRPSFCPQCWGGP